MNYHDYQVFISHGSSDLWVAEQLSGHVESCGGSSFLDEKHVPKGGNFKQIIHREIKRSKELLVLFTPWSIGRSWVWIEVGAAWALKRRIVAILYGLSVGDFEEQSGGKGVFEDINITDINNVHVYFRELAARIQASAQK